MNSLTKFVKNHKAFLTALILIIGCMLRLCAVGSVPYGLNQDEASAGYDAWALLNYGTDRNGCSLPALFISWGSGQNVLMSYLAMPFIKVLGLNELSIRLPNALMGCLSIAFFGLLGKKSRGELFGLCTMGVLAFCPWHIMASRWALESNLLPGMLLLGAFFCVCAEEKPWMLILAGICFGLSLYAYGTAFFFLILFLPAAIILLIRKQMKIRWILASAAIFILIAFPITLTQLINVLGMDEISIGKLTLPILTESRQASTSIFGGGGLRAALSNLSNAVKILFLQSDGLKYNSLGLKYGGIATILLIPSGIYGLISILRRRSRWKHSWVMITWLGCTAVCCAFIDGNINRLNMLWLPLIWMEAAGIYEFSSYLKRLCFIPALALFLLFIPFFIQYGNTFGETGYSGYFPGLGQAIEEAESVADNDTTIYITDYVNQPYIFALFYSRTPPQEFTDTVAYQNEDAAFRQVLHFGHYEFENAENADILILPYWEAEGMQILGTYGYFSVCKK